MSVFLKRFINNKELMSFAFLKSWNHLFWNKIYFEWFAETIYHNVSSEAKNPANTSRKIQFNTLQIPENIP